MPKYALFRSFLQKNVVFAQTVTFLRKKTAGGHTPGLNQRLYLPEMPTFEILMPIVFKYQPI